MVSFKNTVIIMTSNLGSQWLLSDDSDADLSDKVMESVRDRFKPEFLNRVDEILVFHRLGRDDLSQIVEIQLLGLVNRLAERGISLVVNDEAKRFLATTGYDPAYGARPLKRLIQRDMENPLALKLLDGSFKEGDTVEVSVHDGSLVFTSAVSPGA
jgi:ATP-dependent Clp protease ATP-binding subunit ClpB